MTRRLAGLDPLAARFDHFLIDQFGVLLDGSGAYPGAAEALSRLAAMGKRIVLLSNSGRRSGPNAARLQALGFAPDSFLMVLSSGEVAHRALSARIGADLPRGARVLLLTRQAGDRSAIEGLDLSVTDDAAEADLVMITGSRGDEIALERYRHMLAPAAARGVPAICTNPDREMLTPRGTRFGAGRIAEAYEAMGGPVEWIGKPYPAIYAAAAEVLDAPDPGGVLCIGDSPAHDIRGGRAAGHATALVATGIHADLDAEALLAHCAAEDAVPDYLLPRFAFAE